MDKIWFNGFNWTDSDGLDLIITIFHPTLKKMLNEEWQLVNKSYIYLFDRLKKGKGIQTHTTIKCYHMKLLKQEILIFVIISF